jgi:hypothetical protein
MRYIFKGPAIFNKRYVMADIMTLDIPNYFPNSTPSFLGYEDIL